MTAPIFLLVTLAIVLKAVSTGPFEHGYYINSSLPKTNSVSDSVSLVKRNNLRIFNETLLNGSIQKRVKRNGLEDHCAFFNTLYTHPHPLNDSKYYKDIDCVTVISGAEGTILELKFVDIFDIEYHPLCDYDYLEIRDGTRGYGTLLGGSKLCGQQFPGPINTTGPHAWLKFHSDETIENEGFHIKVTEIQSTKSIVVPKSCHITLTGNTGVLDINSITQKCTDDSSNQALEVLWTIEASTNRQIALNFTEFKLAKINSCKDNVVQVFGSIIEFDSRLGHFCGSIAEPVTTIADASKGEEGNVMNIRFYASKATKDTQKFSAHYTVFRKLDTSVKDDACEKGEEFDCQDGTCISSKLVCDEYANCRLKADEQPELCKGEIDVFDQDIQVIVIILSLIVSGMMIVFLFKCFKKLYTDHKIIKENIRQSMENGLENLSIIRLTLDEKSERDNHHLDFLEKEKENLIKQNISKQKPRSIDSIFNQESRVNSDIEIWRRDVDAVPEADKVKVEQNGRTKRSDLSKKEENLRIKNDNTDRKMKKEVQNAGADYNIQTNIVKNEENNKNLVDVSVGTTDVKEFGCQTRDSLFLTSPPPSSNGSDSNSRGISSVGFSEATIARPSSPPQTTATGITIELFKHPQGPVKTKNKSPDRRPASAETTRSAPDVIIVATPIEGDL